MLRRRPLSLPYEDQVPALAALLAPGPQPAADTDRLMEAVLYHRMTGFAALAVERGDLQLAAPARGRLARIGAVSALHSAALRRELAAIEPALADACAAPPVCVKGPAVADRLYPDARLRTFADLDLLVPRAALRDATRALTARGYEQMHEFRPGFGEHHGHDVRLRRKIGSRTLVVELHWRVGDDPACSGLDHAGLAAATRIEVEGTPVCVPAEAEQLVCTAVHLLSDRTKRLIWVVDLALAGRGAAEADWERAFGLAHSLGLGWALHRGLDYAARHLEFARARPLPAEPPPPWGPLRAVEELDLRASLHVGRLASLGWRDRARYLRDVLVPTREGLAGTAGLDGSADGRLVRRHLRSVARGLRPGQR